MSLENILLGALRQPASGYQIKHDFDRLFDNFWTAELSQIYRTLKSLEARGYLESHLEPSDHGPSRRIYKRTTAGQAALYEWLRQEPAVEHVRTPYLAQVFLLGDLENSSRTAETLQTVLDHYTARLERLEGIQRKWKAADPDYPYCLASMDFHEQLVLTHGISRARANIRWAEEALAQVEKRRRREASAEP